MDWEDRIGDPPIKLADPDNPWQWPDLFWWLR
jgi:hypothetical protein